MGRKNNRLDKSDPLPESVADLGMPPPREPGKKFRLETREEHRSRLAQEFDRRRDRSNARADARITASIDWAICCIPGCDTELSVRVRTPTRSHVYETSRRPPNAGKKLPICSRHEIIISNAVVPNLARDDYLEVRHKLARQYVEADVARAVEFDIRHENNGAAEGQIYFVRLNGMVKVGWSKKLRSRLKAYGASAEVLCHFPATRADETLMHRQLRPFLAMGREWYQDCPLISDTVSGIIERHGQPCVFPTWTVPKSDVVASKRHSA